MRGLFYGDGKQLIASIIGIVVNLVFVGGAAAIAFKIIGAFIPNRASADDEIAGLDVPEMGAPGYADAMGTTVEEAEASSTGQARALVGERQTT